MAANFKLPPGWYRETITRLIDEELPPLLGPLVKETAWRYVYAVVLWAESIDGRSYLHLNDQLGKKSGRDLADRGARYLEEHLTPASYGGNLLELIDYIGDEYRGERKLQRHAPPKKRDPNVTGTAFEVVLQLIIERICGVMPARTPELKTLQGFELAPVGYHSRPDLALFNARDFRLLISTKWTLRKERIGTYLHEAYYYKQRRPDLQVAFVVSEYNMNILQWLSADPLVDRVYHVHLPMLLHSHPPFPDVHRDGSIPKSRLLKAGRELASFRRYLELQDRLFDLSQLFADITLLRQADAPVEPEVELDEDEEPPLD
jgi:hypothetical protein